MPAAWFANLGAALRRLAEAQKPKVETPDRHRKVEKPVRRIRVADYVNVGSHPRPDGMDGDARTTSTRPCGKALKDNHDVEIV